MSFGAGSERIVGRISELWRYPVKSMLGERITGSEVGTDGLRHDRRFALRDIASGAFLSAKRVPDLLTFQARVSRDGLLGIEFPDGYLAAWGRKDLDDRLSQALGRQVELLDTSSVSEAQITTEPGDDADTFGSPVGFFDESVLHLLSDTDLASAADLYPDGNWDVRRFRPNIVIETSGGGQSGSVEWIGRGLRLGQDLLVSITKGCTRCVMTTRAQEGLERDQQIQKTLIRSADNVLGVRASVLIAGAVALGDPVTLVG